VLIGAIYSSDSTQEDNAASVCVRFRCCWITAIRRRSCRWRESISVERSVFVHSTATSIHGSCWKQWPFRITTGDAPRAARPKALAYTASEKVSSEPLPDFTTKNETIGVAQIRCVALSLDWHGLFHVTFGKGSTIKLSFGRSFVFKNRVKNWQSIFYLLTARYMVSISVSAPSSTTATSSVPVTTTASCNVKYRFATQRILWTACGSRYTISVQKLSPTDTAYWAKNYVTILTRTAHWMTLILAN